MNDTKWKDKKMDSKRNCKKIRCARCGKNILFNKNDIYEDENDGKFVDCESCGYSNKLKNIK